MTKYFGAPSAKSIGAKRAWARRKAAAKAVVPVTTDIDGQIARLLKIIDIETRRASDFEKRVAELEEQLQKDVDAAREAAEDAAFVDLVNYVEAYRDARSV